MQQCKKQLNHETLEEEQEKAHSDVHTVAVHVPADDEKGDGSQEDDVWVVHAAVVGFRDEGRQRDASQLQQEDPPRVVQRGSHTLSRLLRHQIRGAKAYMLIEDVTGGAPRQPRNPSRLWRRRCTTSSSYAASVRWTAKTTETAMSSS